MIHKAHNNIPNKMKFDSNQCFSLSRHLSRRGCRADSQRVHLPAFLARLFITSQAQNIILYSTSGSPIFQTDLIQPNKSSMYQRAGTRALLPQKTVVLHVLTYYTCCLKFHPGYTYNYIHQQILSYPMKNSGTILPASSVESAFDRAATNTILNINLGHRGHNI